MIGHEKGIFGKHGVNVEPVYYDVYTASFSDLQSGKLDGMLMGLGDVTLNEGRSPGTIRFILVTDISMEAEGIVALPTIASPADLVGKNTACRLRSYGELFVRRTLVAYTIGVDEVNLVNMPIESVPGALASGEIQAGHTRPASSTDCRSGCVGPGHIPWDCSSAKPHPSDCTPDWHSRKSQGWGFDRTSSCRLSGRDWRIGRHLQ